MTSKFLSEANDRFQHPYALFALELLPKLAPDGIAVFLDVTNRQSDERGGKWANLQMNEELDAFRQCHAEFRTLFPMVCDGCKGGCEAFPQFMFEIQQAGFPYQYSSHLSCRVMCRDGLWANVKQSSKPTWWPLTVTKRTWCGDDECADTEQRNMAVMPACCSNYDYF